MENNKNKVPFKEWPWWVKIIAMPMNNRIKPEKHIVLVIISLLIISFYVFWKPLFLNDLIVNDKFIFIGYINFVILVLWQALATMWINDNSSWEIIKISIFKRILAGSLILLLFALPIVLLILLI